MADVLSHCTPISFAVSDISRSSYQKLICYVETHTDDDPIISSMYVLNIERRILDKILYEVDSSDIPR
jgi:hypothetical protein